MLALQNGQSTANPLQTLETRAKLVGKSRTAFTPSATDGSLFISTTRGKTLRWGGEGASDGHALFKYAPL